MSVSKLHLSNEQLIVISSKLRKMLGPRPEPGVERLGAYLGNGVAEGADIRSLQLAHAIDELIVRRNKKWYQFWRKV